MGCVVCRVQLLRPHSLGTAFLPIGAECRCGFEWVRWSHGVAAVRTLAQDVKTVSECVEEGKRTGADGVTFHAPVWSTPKPYGTCTLYHSKSAPSWHPIAPASPSWPPDVNRVMTGTDFWGCRLLRMCVLSAVRAMRGAEVSCWMPISEPSGGAAFWSLNRLRGALPPSRAPCC